MAPDLIAQAGVAEALYTNINSEEDVRTMIENEEAERLHLDFKSRPKPGDMRKVLGRAQSGFANADGGVLIFGVADHHGVRTLQPISDVAVFERQVNELLPRAVSYPVPGVQVKRVPATAESGFLVVIVPQSDLAPHQAVETKQYHRRHGDSFPPMEHYEVADAFGRRHQPRLMVQHDWRKVPEKSQGPHRHVYRMTFSLENRGRGIALHYGFDLKMPCSLNPEWTSAPFRADRESIHFSYRNDPNRPLFPGETLALGSVAVEYTVTEDVHEKLKDSTVMTMTVYSDNAPSRTESHPFESITNF